tara:strand:- start:1 stop:252 length:252 start_codon:yes stop_codon:yes gene_type:complete
MLDVSNANRRLPPEGGYVNCEIKKKRGEATSRLASGTVKGQLLLAFSLRISNAVAPPEAMRLGEARSQAKSKTIRQKKGHYHA